MRKWYQEERLAVVDLGTNAIRLNVYEGYVSIYQEKTFTGLGSTLSTNGRLSPQGKDIVWRKLKEYRKIISLLEVSHTAVLATEALRSCSESSKFISKLRSLESMPMTILSGEEEARFLSKGVVTVFPDATGLVCDCGGGSVEIASLEKGTIQDLRSFPYGVMRMRSTLLKMRRPTLYIQKMLAENSWIANLKKRQTVYITGGTWRMLAQMFMGYKKYPFSWINNYQPNLPAFLSYIRDVPNIQLGHSLGSKVKNQSRLLPTAALLLENFLNILQPDKIIFCAYGLREGYLRSLLEKRKFSDSPLVSYARYEARGSDRATVKQVPQKLKSFNLHSDILMAAYLLAAMKNPAPEEYKGDNAFLSIIDFPLVGCTHKEFIFLAYAVGLSFGTVNLTGKKDELIQYFLTEEDKSLAEKLSRAIALI